MLSFASPLFLLLWVCDHGMPGLREYSAAKNFGISKADIGVSDVFVFTTTVRGVHGTECHLDWGAKFVCFDMPQPSRNFMYS